MKWKTRFPAFKLLFLLGIVSLNYCSQNEGLTSSMPMTSSVAIRSSEKTQSDEEIYQRGLQIMQTEGVDAGLRYFEEKPVSHQSLFGIGWGYWTKGSYDKAEQVCRYLMARQIDQTILAHVNYLMGYLHIQYVKYPEAMSYFNVALPIYQKTEKPKDQFRTIIGLATAQFYLAKYQETEDLLGKALKIFDAYGLQLNLGMYYYLKAHVAFSQKDYQLALSFSQDSLAEYKKTSSVKDMVSGMIDVAFYQQMTGEYDAGYETAENAHELILKHNLSRLSYFNTINFILYNRCNGLEYGSDERVVRQAAKTGKDSLMIETLDFVLNLECP